jgi:PAS domain S-box-containing protein
MPSTHPSDQPEPQASPVSAPYFRTRLAGGVILVNMFIVALVGLSIYQSHRHHHELAEITTRNLAQTLESEIAGAVETDDIALFAVIDEYKRQRANGAVDGKTLNAYIDQVNSRLPEIDGLRITDAQGVLVYGKDVMPGAKTSLADRPHFIRLRDDPQAGLVISRPQMSCANQKWVIALCRRIDQPDGSFGGIALAAITLKHFSKAFSALDVGTHGAIALRDGELGLIVRYPALQGAASVINNKPVAREFSEMVATGNTDGTFTVHSGSDNVERTYSYRKIGSYPLYIIVGLATEDYLAEWSNEAANQAALAALFALMTFLAAWLIHRMWKRQVNSVEALVRQEAKFRTVADFTFDWEYWQGPQGEILYMTPSCERVTGYTQAEFVADPGLLLRVIHPEDLHVMQRHLHEIAHQAADQSGTQLEFRILCRNGEIRWIGHNCRAIFDRNGESRGRRVGNRDITEHKRAEAELITANQAAESANLAKSRFLAAASHDLRQPLQAISMFHEALARTGLNEKQISIIQSISKSLNSLGEMLNRFLDISRLDGDMIKPQPVMIQAVDLLGTIDAEFASLAQKKNLRINLFCPRKGLTLFSDANFLMDLLRNLVSNAVKYTEHGGILVSIRRRGDSALIQVWDSGIGIAPEHQALIFEENFQVDNPERDRAKGVGLGLAIVRRLSELLGSEVRCQSRVGRGSVFGISVPLAKESDEHESPAQTSAPLAANAFARFSGKRIVVIEDDALAAEAIKLSLEMLDMQVTLFSTAEAALGSAEALGADYYISDYRLPGMDGLQLLDAIQRASPRPINALLLTGNASPYRNETTQSFRWKVLFKPIELPELLSAFESQDPSEGIPQTRRRTS